MMLSIKDNIIVLRIMLQFARTIDHLLLEAHHGKTMSIKRKQVFSEHKSF